MDKLNPLLNANILDFAQAFGSATSDLFDEDPPAGYSLHLEGWLVAARAGYVLGEGEFVHDGQPRRFHFCALPPRQGAASLLCACGSITRLRRLSDFSGLYLFCDSAPTGPQGRARARLQNEHGVVIDLLGPRGDRLFDLPYGGLRVRLAGD
jgi:hypothetical protein